MGIGQVFFGETEKSFREKSFQEFSREISRAPVQRELEGERGISSTKEERSPHMFYQGTLWYRRRFKGDSTMFTECRGLRQIDGGREGRAERCIEACMPLVGLSCKPPLLEPALLLPYSIFRSTSIPCLATCNHTTVHTISAFSSRPFHSSRRPIYNRFFSYAHLAYHVGFSSMHGEREIR